MANEHTLFFETEQAVPFTCSNTAGIEQGTLLALSDPATAAAAVENDYILGVAKTEKINGDGKTKISVYLGGIFKATAAGNITAGQAIAASGSNVVKVAAAAHVGAKTLGIALETAANGETFLYKLMPGCNNTAYS